MDISGNAKGFSYDLGAEADIFIMYGVFELVIWSMLAVPAIVSLIKRAYIMNVTEGEKGEIMKMRIAEILGIMATLSPIVGAIIALQIQAEFVEALIFGVIAGCVLGSIFGVISLSINKGRKRLIKVLSVIPMLPLAMYLILMIPYLVYNCT